MENHKAYVDRLVEGHRSYAHAIAADILKTLPPQVERAEVQSAAELGLVEAAVAFDARPGVQFKTFAFYRIRGAVYDSIRKATWFSRKQYRDYLAAAGANEYLADQTTSLDPNAPASIEELDRHVGAVVACFMLSLQTSKTETPVDHKQSVEETMLEREAQTRVRDAVAHLPERNRKVIEGCYYQNRTLEEIGLEMGLSKSWACRLHAKGIEMLRDLMKIPAPSHEKRPPVPVAGNLRAARTITPVR